MKKLDNFDEIVNGINSKICQLEAKMDVRAQPAKPAPTPSGPVSNISDSVIADLQAQIDGLSVSLKDKLDKSEAQAKFD